MKPTDNLTAAVAPTGAAAKRAASYLTRGRAARVVPFSLRRYLQTADAPSRILLCPAGRDCAADLAFLRTASRRLLWATPSAVVAEAIEGMLGLEEGASARRRPRPERSAAGAVEAGGTYFLEGAITAERAMALVKAGVRRWIALNPRAVRVGGRLFDRLDRLGVRWLALAPVELAGVLASPSLARSRSRWKGLLPSGTPVRVRKPG